MLSIVANSASKSVTPARILVVVAVRQDRDDVACWDLDEGGVGDSPRPYIGELTALLVDLVDAAVEHQAAALYNDSVVTVTLKELEERHSARAAGHDEVADW
jgi:hypothetical protein